MTDGEIKGKKFLEYVAQNDKRLRRNLRKNITFDEGLFDDIFQDSIIKVYNSIVKNNKDIDDYEQYFFTSSKFNYILKQNSERERIKKRINIDDYIQNKDIEQEDYSEINSLCLLNDIREVIEDEFGTTNSDLYFDYMILKVEGGMSYNRYSQLKGIPVSKISDIVSRIKNFCKKHTKISELKHALD